MEWETRLEEKKRFWFQAPREKEETSWHPRDGGPGLARYVLYWYQSTRAWVGRH